MEFLIYEAVIPQKAFSRESWYMGFSTKDFCVKPNQIIFSFSLADQTAWLKIQNILKIIYSLLSFGAEAV